MVSIRAVRRTAVAVCAGGIAGMIVSSVLNHNGAAITFGLITAAAVLCSMVATAVAADVTRQLTAPPAGGGPSMTAPDETAPPTSSASSPIASDDERQAALVETLVDDLVLAGTDEADVRELVRQSVRLGRILAIR
jgi:hypothetical protein